MAASDTEHTGGESPQPNFPPRRSLRQTPATTPPPPPVGASAGAGEGTASPQFVPVKRAPTFDEIIAGTATESGPERRPERRPGTAAPIAAPAAAESTGQAAGRTEPAAAKPSFIPTRRKRRRDRHETPAAVGAQTENPATDTAPTAPSGGVRLLLWVREIVMILVVALILSALVKHFLIQNFQIPSGSMENTLHVDDRISVTRLAPGIRELNRGDIVVFEDSQHWLQSEGVTAKRSTFNDILITLGIRPDDRSQHLVKRIIGMPGDRVQCCDAQGRIIVNGVAINEPYLKEGVLPSEQPFDVTVPAGHLWVMGDNRANSGDSRVHINQPGGGFVPIADVTGRAFAVWWPLNRIQTLNSGGAFSGVPNPK